MVKLKKETVTEEFDQEGKVLKRITLREYEEGTDAPIYLSRDNWPFYPYYPCDGTAYPRRFEITYQRSPGH